MSNLNALADELGIPVEQLKAGIKHASGVTPEAPKNVRAPDGGPLSNFRAANTVINPTILVYDKELDTERVIAKKDFDEKIHKKVKQPRAKLPEDNNDGGGDAETEDEARERLASMTIDGLKGLPEYEEVEDKSSLKKKDDYIDAILAVLFPDDGSQG